MNVKTRFAPSPTGDLHLGGARTALFAWLYARHHGGQFVLRIEDTDRERSSQASVDVILHAMQWLGLDVDEGPFYQTQRLDRYQQQLEYLLAEGKAYRCYCSKERLNFLRDKQMQYGEKPKYDGLCLEHEKEIRDEPFVVRFKQTSEGTLRFDDLVRGSIEINNAELDDMILARSDGSPTYNFTVVVDDGDMGITHVLRGDDHINNTPRQIHLYQALGYELPHFGHLSSILGPDGKRLSKRHGAVSVLAYRDAGYLPEAILNMLARLGWSHGDQEIFSRDELIQLFDLDSVQKAAASYSTEKLDWLNQQHIMAMAPESLVDLLQQQLLLHGVSEKALQQGPGLADVAALHQSRSKTMVDMAKQSAWLFEPLPVYGTQALSAEDLPYLASLEKGFSELNDWNRNSIQAVIKQVVTNADVGFGKVGKPLRIAVSAGLSSVNLPDLLAVLGQNLVIDRIQKSQVWLFEQ